MFVLYIENPQGSVKKPEFKENEITFGRAKDNTIVLPERNISRHHLKIYRDGDTLMVTDAGSRYGVEYREEPLEQPEKLIPNAYIRIGDYRIKLISDSVAKVAKHDNIGGMFTPETEQKQTTQEYIPTKKELVEELDSDDSWQEEPQKSSKKGLIAIIAALLVLSAGGYFMFAGKEKPVKTTSNKNPALLATNKTPKKKHQEKPVVTAQKDAAIKAMKPRDAGRQKAVAVKTEPKPVKKIVITEKKAKKPVVKKAVPAPKPVKRHKVIAMVRHTRPRRPVRRIKRVVEKPKPAPDKTDQVNEMLSQARHAPYSSRISKLKQCLSKYGNRCCRAHKYMADWFRGNGNIKKAILQLRSYKACTSSASEKNRADRTINLLQGL